MAARKNRGFDNKVVKSFSLILQFSLYMIVPIAGMTALGIFLDRKFGTSWIVILCFFMGAIAGAQSVYKLAMKIAQQKQEEPERNIINRRNKENTAESANDSVPEEKE